MGWRRMTQARLELSWNHRLSRPQFGTEVEKKVDFEGPLRDLSFWDKGFKIVYRPFRGTCPPGLWAG